MTVSALWKALDAAGCGIPVGIQELSNVEQNGDKRTTLAVDLSIWICESLTSKSTSANHANPALHLVYSRSVKLLSLGIKLVVVIEGKRRILRTDDNDEKFRNRRTGSAFWEACKSCEKMLRLLGVPVIRAKAEGEALCALLNERGIVDGVISNDGDCLLFGAQVIYTRFSLENLEKAQVMRYDMRKLHVTCNNSGDMDDERSITGLKNGKVVPIQLSRKDLIAFALLTGSDLAGNGLPNVGGKKAIRFIAECKRTNPLSLQSAAIDELKSWSRAAKYSHLLEAKHKSTEAKCCSGCGHEGSKKYHLKHGCSCCGTEPGEPCFNVSHGARFRKSLRDKALAMQPKFDPDQTVASYMRPNDNQIPASLASVTARTIEMRLPQLNAFVQSDMIVRGRGLDESRDFVRQSLSRLMARSQLFPQHQTAQESGNCHGNFSREAPIPKEITKKLVHHGVPSYEVAWRVSATLTDDVGNDVDGYDFCTVESQLLIDQRFPELAAAFQEKEVELAKQGDAEQERRREFIRSLLNPFNQPAPFDPISKKRRRIDKQRVNFFEKKRSKRKSPKMPKGYYEQASNLKFLGGGDVEQLLRTIETGPSSQKHSTSTPSLPRKVVVDMEEKSFVSDLSELTTFAQDEDSVKYSESQIGLVVKLGAGLQPDWWPISTPRNSEELECNMGIQIAVTPLVSSKTFFRARCAGNGVAVW